MMKNPPHTFCEYFPKGLDILFWNIYKRRGPEQAFYISKALYQKAETRNQELSDDEVRDQSQGRQWKSKQHGDIHSMLMEHFPAACHPLEPRRPFRPSIGPTAVADPGREVRDPALGPAREAARSHPPRIGGQISQPLELLDKIRTSPSLSAAYASLTIDELELLVERFRARPPAVGDGRWPDAEHWFPGNQEARNLILAREGFADPAYELRERHAKFQATERSGATGLLVQRLEPLGLRKFPFPLTLKKPKENGEEEEESLPALTPGEQPAVCMWDPDDETPRSPTRDDVDEHGRPAWPRLPGRDWSYPAAPQILFRDDAHKKPNWDEEFRWLEGSFGWGKGLVAIYAYKALTMEERVGYEVRSEQLRHEAWDELEQRKRDGKMPYDL
ncbi:uncharacterized protein PG998_012928 [Apiospora kogelbergensis]|uniref:uncharacterized protein n=1 Tax=Apiospora kogelbergensis TaxID=1337665 RepID=UPI00312F9EB7